MGALRLRRLNWRMGKPGLTVVLSRLLQRSVGILSGRRRFSRLYDHESLRRQEWVLDRECLWQGAAAFGPPAGRPRAFDHGADESLRTGAGNAQPFRRAT